MALNADSRYALACDTWSRILIIDDRIDDGDALCVMLQFEGLTVESVQSGIEGLLRVRAKPPNLVVLDLQMPDLHGLKILAGIRADSDVPVIVVTGECLDEESERTARALGIVAFLRKPIYIEGLMEPVRAALGTGAPAIAPTLVGPGIGVQSPESTDGGHFSEANRVVEELLPMLYRRIQEAYPRRSPQLVVDAVNDAVMEKLQCGQVRVPADARFVHLLLQAAWRNMSNTVHSEARRRAREEHFATTRPMAEEPLDLASECEAAEQRTQLLALATNEADRRGIELWLDDASTQEIAEALGYGDLSSAQRRSEVKRFKDKILIRGRRSLSKRRDG